MALPRADRDGLITASDLQTREIDLPTIGMSVVVRSLPAAYSNQAQSEALKLISGPRGDQTATVDTGKLEVLQVLHGLVEPKLNSIEDAQTFAQKCGPAFKEVIRVIDQISGIRAEDKAAVDERFPAQRTGPDGAGMGNGIADGSTPADVPSGTGRDAGDDDK